MKHTFLTLSLCVLLLPACAIRKEIAATKSDTAYLRAQVDSLRVEQRRLRADLAGLRSLAQQTVDVANRLRADLQVQLGQVAEQTQVLSDRLEDTGRRISNLPSKLRYVAPPPPAPTVSAPPDTANKATAAPPDSTKPEVAQPAAGDAQQIYEAAYQDLVKGQYDIARQGFQQYLQMEPEGALADNAHYWIGESYYSQKNHEEAIKEFNVVLDKFAEGDKVPSAMLKLGYAQIAMGKRAEGRKNLEALIKKFPQSNEANLAKARLKELR
jgi:tol-pal system protein YbgF